MFRVSTYRLGFRVLTINHWANNYIGNYQWVMFGPNSSVLFNKILHQIIDQKDGNTISRGTVTTAIKSFFALGIESQDWKKLNFNVYTQAFEISFSARIEDYYREQRIF